MPSDADFPGSPMNQPLSQADVKRLLEDPSAENRSRTAQKVAAGYSDGLLTAEERRIAEDIFNVMVRDAEVRVREALSDNLKNCSFIAHALVTPLIAIVYFCPNYSESLLLLGFPWGITAPLFMLLLALMLRRRQTEPET